MHHRIANTDNDRLSFARLDLSIFERLPVGVTCA